MNQKELNELRRRFRLDKNNFSRVYGCYVNSNREIIAWVDTSMGLMRQEEQEMYLGLLKKSLSGTLGKNLIDVVFSTQQVADSDEHRLLQTLRQTELKDPASRETLCRQIIDCIDMGETNYLILLAADAYDVPHRSKDDEIQADASSEVFKYFVCSICPVKAPTLELRYDLDQSEFHSSSTGYIATSPELGFLYPAFDNRTANIYNVLFYSKNAAEIHQEVIDALFHVDPPMSAEEQKNAFGSALADALDKDCSYDVVQSVHEQIRARIEDHKESKDPEPLEMTAGDVGGILANSGVNDEQIAAAQTFIQSEVDYLLISAAGTSGWDSVLKDAQAQGIKVILFDRTIDADESLYEASIVSDMAKEGQTAVDWLASQGLSEYNIVHIQGTMGSAAQVGRTGALDTKVAENDSWNLVTQQTADWNAETAQQIVQSIIDSGTSFNVIYAENDDMAKGAVAALDKANISHGVGKDVIVMGFDCNKWALENLLSGSWNYDGQCNPFQASYIDSIIKDLENGKSPENKVIIMDEKGFDASTITQEDVDKYGI